MKPYENECCNEAYQAGLEDANFEYEESLEGTRIEALEEGYEEGYEAARAEISSFAEKLRQAGVTSIEDFVARWDAAERRWRVVQAGRTVYLPKET